MSGSTYAIFQGGQTLTHDELNLSIDFLDAENQRLGRVVGFGISCGLDGTLLGNTLTIGHGRALDQIGRALEHGVAALAPTGDRPAQLHEGLPSKFDLNTATPVGETGPVVVADAFDFIDIGPGGFTPILRVLESDEVSPPCPADSCEKHATIRCREAQIVFVPGQLIVPPADPDRVTLRDLGVIDIDPSGRLLSPAAPLRDELLRILTAAGLPADALAVLDGLSFTAGTTDLIKAQRAGLLNRLLFYTLEFIRCREAAARACVHETTTPGVALGWLDGGPGNWRWDCSYRHDWVTPVRELADGFLARRCKSPCSLQFERIEAELLSFVEIPESVPPEEGGDPGGGVHPCLFCGDFGFFEEYLWVLEYMDRPWVEDGPRGIPGGGYTDPPPEPLWEGTVRPGDHLHVDGVLGWGTGAALENVVSVLEQDAHVVNPGVDVISSGDVATHEGFVMTTMPAIGDRIVLVENGAGRVVGMGAVPLSSTIGQNGTAIAQVGETAVEVGKLAIELDGVRTDVAGAVGLAAQLEAEAGRLGTGTVVETLNALTFENQAMVDVVRTVEQLGYQTDDLKMVLDETRFDARMASNRVHELSLQFVGPQKERQFGSSAELGGIIDVVEKMVTATRAAAGTDEQRQRVDAVVATMQPGLDELRNIAVAGSGVDGAMGQMVGVFGEMAKAVRAAGATPSQMRATNRALSEFEAQLR